MAPTLVNGQGVLVDPRAFQMRAPEVGELVQLRDPREPGHLLVKRVASVEEGAVFVLGDNPGKSTDSREFGLVALDMVLGGVVCTFSG